LAAKAAALLGRILILQLLTSNEKQVEEQTKVHDRPEPARIQEWKGFKGVEGKGIKNSLRAGYNALGRTRAWKIHHSLRKLASKEKPPF